MRFVNRTHYRTDHLKAIAHRVAERELDPEKRKRVVVEVVYSRTRHVSGKAWIGGRNMVIRIPRSGASRPEVAFVFAHEYAHLRGMRHRAMGPSYKWSTGMSLFAWADAMPLEVKPERGAPTLDEKRERRIEHARDMVARWEQNVKRGETHLRKWTRRLRAAERRMGVAASPSQLRKS